MRNDAQRHRHILVDVHLVDSLKLGEVGLRRDVILSKYHILSRLRRTRRSTACARKEHRD